MKNGLKQQSQIYAMRRCGNGSSVAIGIRQTKHHLILSEGGYLYFDGGPFDAEEELYSRFGKIFPDKVIRKVVDDVESDGITEWASIHRGFNYDLEFEYEVPARDAPYKTFMERIADVNTLSATSELDSKQQELLRKLLYSSLITALEAYLADLMSYWLKAENDVFRNFVRNCEAFKGHKIPLASIYDKLDTLPEFVGKYVQGLVWHRLDKVIPPLTKALGIKMPEIDRLVEQILVRHDIVHRSGKTMDGKDVTITQDKFNELRIGVISFIDDIEGKIRQRFPV